MGPTALGGGRNDFDDPQCPSNKTNTLPQPECRIAAGQKQIGYAAAQSLGYTSAHGELSRWDIAYIVREYLEYLLREV